MKKLLLTLFFMFAITVPVHAATFYRVILDLPFDNLTTAINFMNLIETHKNKVYTGVTLEGLTANAKMVGSWDTEFFNAPEYNMITVDFTEETQNYDAETFTITQDDVDAKQAYIDAKMAKLIELQSAVDAAQDEIDNP